MLAAGEYTLLPARYGMLPGAVLIEARSGFTDIQPFTGRPLPDGGQLVAGVRSVAGTNIKDSRTNGFVVYDGDFVNTLAEYNYFSGNEFFAARAAAADLPPPFLARDGGLLQLLAEDILELNGAVASNGDTGGRGSRVDVSAAALRVSADGTNESSAVLEVSGEQLSALGAESLILGGTRTRVLDGTALDDPQLRSRLAENTIEPQRWHPVGP